MGIFSQTVLGVDIGDDSIKVVGLRLGRKPYFLGCKKIGVNPALVKKEGFQQPDEIGRILREALKQAAPKSLHIAPAYTAIPESLTFRKALDMPMIEDPEQLLDAIKLEVTQYLPSSLAEIELDYQQLSVSADRKTQQIMVVTVPKKVVQGYVEVFKAAQIPLKAIDVKPASVGRAAVSFQERDALVLVDIGSVLSSISVYFNGRLQVTGTINLGGNLIRDPIKGEYVADHEAQLKRVSSALADEIDHVVKFYMNRTTNPQTVREIRVSGGGSLIVGMLESLAQETELPVVPAKAILTLPPFCDRSFLVALGNALYPFRQNL